LRESAQNKPGQLIVFSIDEQQYALHLSAVERVVPSAEITPLPKAPEIVLGVVNVQGRIIPVVNIRKRFRLAEREIDLRDQLILARTLRRPVALVADAVRGVIERPQQDVIATAKILPGLDYLEGVVKLDDGMILIHDLDKFLSLDEEKTLEDALNSHG
jgi:purine-binding chemotaxis protein CheW